MNIEDIKIKAAKIIDSSVTKEQLETAYRYIDLFISIIPEPERLEIQNYLKEAWEIKDRSLFNK